MKVIDTVMSRKIYEGDNAYEERVKQAEISFKAGIKEVVEELAHYWDAIPLIQLTTTNRWQAKLKEWRVESG